MALRGMKPVSAEWLRGKYHDEKLSCVDIGKIVGRDPKSVHTWMRDYGIPTRPRGMNNRDNFKKGERSGFSGRKHSDETKAKIRAARKLDGHYPKDNGRPYWSGKKGEDHPSWSGGATPERQAFYSSSEWRLSRSLVYAKARGSCERCGSTDALHIHHVVPFMFVRLRADPRNLKVLCAPCHRFVHSLGNVDREFLPERFAVIPHEKNGRTILISISYKPKHRGTLPQWMT